MEKILLVSKFREFQGGVERHIYDLIDGLSSIGYEAKLFSSEDVIDAGGKVFSATSAGRNKFSSARQLLWNRQARLLLSELIGTFKPDVVHYHSISHQLSPSVLGVYSGPSVMTLHDYKLSAPCYTLVRNDDVCQECVGKTFAFPAVRHKCISGSVTGSGLCALEGAIHGHRFRASVDRFIVPSVYAQDIAVRGGIPSDRVSVVPWGVTGSRLHSVPAGPIAFYAGRFHRTKGIRLLLDAWASLPTGHNCLLRIAGEGELEPEVRQAALRDPSIIYLGMLSHRDVSREVTNAAVVVMPSLAPETMGLSALEALMVGTPVLSSGRGALSDLSGPGVYTFTRAEPATLANAIKELLVDGRIDSYRTQLAFRDLSRYTASRMVKDIENVYEMAVSRR